MEPYTLAIDTGTTNTRVFLLDRAGAVLAAAKAETGVRDTAVTGSTARLEAAVKRCLEEVLAAAGAQWDQVGQVLASGMITSNLGLCEIPHCTAPAGAADLAAHAVTRLVPGVCPVPITFFPGVKNAAEPVDAGHFEPMDIMRGEEAEALALLHEYPAGRPYLLVLPGSHMKFVFADAAGRLTGCLTTISGELLAAITTGTILADAVQRQFASPEGYDRELALAGWSTAQQTGLGRACFSGRILSQFGKQPPQAVASYLLGAVLQSDLAAIHGSGALHLEPGAEVIVAGKDPLRRAMADLLAAEGSFPKVHCYEPAPGAAPLAARGVLYLARAAARG